MPVLDTLPLPPPSTPVVIALTAERLDAGDGTRMGLMGLGYERQFTPEWRGGMTLYGAATGSHGGFFAWGVNGTRQWRHGEWQTEAGLFLGGGGGSPSWVGSGLMLRTHLEVGRRADATYWGLGLSQVSFPDGKLHSLQPYLALRLAGSAMLGSSGRAEETEVGVPSNAQAVDTEWSLLGGQYRLRHSPRRDGVGEPANLRYGGLSFRQGLPLAPVAGAKPYGVLTGLGAVGGGYDGYAEVTGGLGLSWPLGQQIEWRTELAVGSAGAGATVDTGGGLIGKLGAALVWRPSRHWSMAAQLGAVHSRGPFSGTEQRLSVAWRGWDWVPAVPSSGVQQTGTAPSGPAVWTPWAVSAGVQHFARMPRDAGPAADLQLMNLQLERPLGPAWHLVAGAATGVGGQAGGYATGRMGLGWFCPPLAAGWQWGAEVAAGAAGGGGVQVQGGLFMQGQLQARVPIAQDWSLQVEAGRLRTARAGTSAPFAGVSLVAGFSRLQGR